MTRFVLAGLTAWLVTLLITPVVRRVAVKLGVIDQPGGRRVHAVPTPRAGGIALYLGFWAAVYAWSLQPTATFTALFVSSTLIVLLGFIDDAVSLRPALKLAGQILAAVILAVWGPRINFVTNPWGGMIYLGWLAIPLTVVWLVAITNTFNFIDGLDGLAAGVATIACVPLFILALNMYQPTAALLTVALAGAAVGFLRYNFNPARIFMGDTGSMFLGFILAAAAVSGALKGAMTVAITVPILAFGVPIFDTAFAIWRRVRNGTPIYQADKGHLHHRLLAAGLSQRQAVLVLYGVSGALGVSALLASGLGPVGRCLLFLAVVLLAGTAAHRLGVIDLGGRGRASRRTA